MFWTNTQTRKYSMIDEEGGLKGNYKIYKFDEIERLTF